MQQLCCTGVGDVLAARRGEPIEVAADPRPVRPSIRLILRSRAIDFCHHYASAPAGRAWWRDSSPWITSPPVELPPVAIPVGGVAAALRQAVKPAPALPSCGRKLVAAFHEAGSAVALAPRMGMPGTRPARASVAGCVDGFLRHGSAARSRKPDIPAGRDERVRMRFIIVTPSAD